MVFDIDSIYPQGTHFFPSNFTGYSERLQPMFLGLNKNQHVSMGFWGPIDPSCWVPLLQDYKTLVHTLTQERHDWTWGTAGEQHSWVMKGIRKVKRRGSYLDVQLEEKNAHGTNQQSFSWNAV